MKKSHGNQPVLFHSRETKATLEATPGVLVVDADPIRAVGIYAEAANKLIQNEISKLDALWHQLSIWMERRK